MARLQLDVDRDKQQEQDLVSFLKALSDKNAD